MARIRHHAAYAEGFDIFKNATSKELPEQHPASTSTCLTSPRLAAAAWSVRGCSI